MRTFALLLLSLVLPLSTSTGINAGEKDVPAAVKDSEKLVMSYLAQIKGSNGVSVDWMNAKELASLFPKSHFFSVRYRQYPVGIAPPQGLSSSNVLMVTENGNVAPMTNEKDLSDFLSEYLKSQEKFDEKLAKSALVASLLFRQELAQDGYYGFEIIKSEVDRNAKGEIIANGRSMVTKGGNGEIQAKMVFSGAGTVALSMSATLRPGPRPRCQATKLLDNDPIVRHMARTEILFMGIAARDYLREQRDQATGELRQAIDNILREVEKAGW